MADDNANRIIITVAQFRTAFPAFASELYPDDFVQTMLDQSYCYVLNLQRGSTACPCQVLMIELMAAHIMYLAKQAESTAASNGATLASGFLQRSKVGEVEVSMAIPTGLTLFRSWLLSTPWGRQLIGLIMAHTMPIFCGGSFNRIYWTSH